MSSTDDRICERARDWLSAARDNEADNDLRSAAHIDDCARCAAWASQMDFITRTTRLRGPVAPLRLHAALPAIVTATEPDDRRLLTIARFLLALTAIAGLISLALGAAGASDHVGLDSLDGLEGLGLNIALLAGFAITAWRRLCTAAGLLPIATTAALTTTVAAALAAPSTEYDLLGELLHVPIVIGAVGAALAFAALANTSASGTQGRRLSHRWSRLDR